MSPRDVMDANFELDKLNFVCGGLCSILRCLIEIEISKHIYPIIYLFFATNK